METIGLHIDYLLLHHSCVTLPGLGSLLRHGREAAYDAERRCWMPPSRTVSFNPDLSRTDGLLSRSIARRDGISDSAAARIVERGVGELRRRLDTDRYVALGHAGTLRLSSEGSLCFQPAPAPRSWMPAVAVADAPAAAAAAVAAAAGRSVRGNIYRTVSRIAACVAVVFALGWIVADNIRYGADRQYASVAPVQPRPMVSQPGEASAPIVWHIRRHADASMPVEQAPAAAPEVTDAPGYYLVVASLASLDEARGYMAAFPGRKLGVLSSDGRFRVYVAKAESAAPLYSAAVSDEITRDFPASWVCRR